MTGHLAEGFLRTQRWEYDSPHFRWSNPSLYTGEAIFGVIVLLQEQTPVVQRLDLVGARLDAIPGLLAQAQTSIRTAPAAWIERARRESAAALLLLGDGINHYLAEHGQEHIGVRTAADRAGSAFAAFDEFLEQELSPRATDAYACGGDTFGLLLRDAHFLDTDAAGLEARALEQIESAEAALVAGAAQFGTADWQTALAALAEIHPSAKQFPSRFPQFWHAARAAVEQHDLVTLPDWPVAVLPSTGLDQARRASPLLHPVPDAGPVRRPAGRCAVHPDPPA